MARESGFLAADQTRIRGRPELSMAPDHNLGEPCYVRTRIFSDLNSIRSQPKTAAEEERTDTPSKKTKIVVSPDKSEDQEIGNFDTVTFFWVKS